ncbi:MAG: polyphosphate kinase 2 family protein, partial [Alphaproteobacteria bacterium]
MTQHPKALAHLRIEPGSNPKLAKIKPREVDFLGERSTAEARLFEDIEAINALQDKLYAEGRRSLLVVLQGTDTAGK